MRTLARASLACVAVMAAVVGVFAVPGLFATEAPALAPGAADAAAIKSALEAMPAAEREAQLSAQGAFLARNPLDRPAMANATALLALSDNHERANAMAKLFADTSLRDRAAQLTAINLSLGSKDFEQAVYRLDGLLAAHPDMGDTLFPMLTSILAQPDGQAAAAARLVAKPAWRDAYLQSLAKTDPGMQQSYLALTAIRKAGGEVQERELRPVLEYLFQAKAYDKAYFVWLDFLNDDQLRHVASVYDGEFDLAPKNYLYDWNLYPTANAKVAIVNRPGSSTNRSLLVDFYESKGEFAHVYQYLRLAPGAYTVRFDAMSNGFQSEGGLVWRFYCIGDAGGMVQSAVLRNAGPWANYSFNADVPAQGCAMQLLRLESASKAVLDTKASGQIYFDSMAILPRDGSGQSPGAATAP